MIKNSANSAKSTAKYLAVQHKDHPSLEDVTHVRAALDEESRKPTGRTLHVKPGKDGYDFLSLNTTDRDQTFSSRATSIAGGDEQPAYDFFEKMCDQIYKDPDNTLSVTNAAAYLSRHILAGRKIAHDGHRAALCCPKPDDGNAAAGRLIGRSRQARLPASDGSPRRFRLQGFQCRITPHPRRDPAPRQAPQQRRRPAPPRAQHAPRVADRTAPVEATRLVPTQGVTSACASARDHAPQRARLGQAAHAATVARRAQRGLGRRGGVDVNGLQ